MAVEINTVRGRYRMAPAAVPANDAAADSGGGEHVMALSFERIDGLERFGLLCRIAGESVAADHAGGGDEILRSLAPWFGREFEQIREAALKSIRVDRRPLMLRFDPAHPGPLLR